MLTNSSTLSRSERVSKGRARENQIANALKAQHGLNIVDASHDEDCVQKIDRWLIDKDGVRHALQIKYRETGDDVLFEVFDRFLGFDDPANKTGRDVQGQSTLYAVLKTDRKTVCVVHCSVARKVIDQMVACVRERGWTVRNAVSKTFYFHAHGLRLELKRQVDPRTGDPKVIAYIPTAYFEAEAQLREFKVGLPKNWN